MLEEVWGRQVLQDVAHETQLDSLVNKGDYNQSCGAGSRVSSVKVSYPCSAMVNLDSDSAQLQCGEVITEFPCFRSPRAL